MKQTLLFILAILFSGFAWAQCEIPTQVAATNTSTSTAVLSWQDSGTPNGFEVVIVPFGSPAPTAAAVGVVIGTAPYTVSGLLCGTSYDAYVRKICAPTEFSEWSAPSTFQTASCSGSGYPENLAMCASDTGTTCFNLTLNDPIVLAAQNPADFVITYYTTQADANAGTNPILNPASYCVPGVTVSSEVYVRIENINTGEFNVHGFAITAQDYLAANMMMTALTQCDDNNDGSITFDLTTAEAQLNTTNTLTYYATTADATTQTNPIPNPASYTISSSFNVSAFIYIRENVAGDCDIVYSLPFNAYVNCNIANFCATANSLCASIGVPFSNTVNNGNAEPGNYDCLGSQPNPTWFYIPISSSGPLSFQIEQNSSVNFDGGQEDVDFICWGPFANPTVACGNPSMMSPSYEVGCSYSTAAVENFTINAVAGQYYIMMVTNFSNQPGYIRITETSGATTGEIDCTGMRFNAFLDSNGNGAMDTGELGFPLGQFSYEMNNDSNIHNITALSGTFSIYDINPLNTYDVSFNIDSAYAANYSLSPASYSNISVVAGVGMQDYYFPITISQAYNDLAVSIIPSQAPRAGFNYSNTVMYTNMGSQTAAAGTVSFIKDPAVSFNGISEPGAIINATGFTFNFTNLLPFESRMIAVNMHVPPIPTVQIGDLLTNSADIIPLAGDLVPENNSSVSSQAVVASYDPNDKMESRGGRILITDFTNQDYLYYTVRFENIGSAAAINIMLADVLDNRLNPETLRMVSSSHDYILDRVGNQLTWKFDDILLPATSQNPTASHGYVHFKVKPNPGYAIGDVIPNTASIFFDFNPAIVSQLSTNEFSESNFIVYPNPARDALTVAMTGGESISSIAIYDMLGKNIFTKKVQTGSASESVDISGISSGIYFLEVECGTAKTVKKLVIE
jgi:hypothetical protein